MDRQTKKNAKRKVIDVLRGVSRMVGRSSSTLGCLSRDRDETLVMLAFEATGSCPDDEAGRV